MQGILEIIHDFDLILRELSGMDQFVFQAGGGADAAYTHCIVTRAYHQSRGELEQRNEIVTSIQAHPCNAATAAAAGFKVVTLMLEEERLSVRRGPEGGRRPAHGGTPHQQSRRHGHLQSAHHGMGEDRARGGRARFYDHANFNGVMGKIRARDLGFDACMYMLHKTFGAPKGGGGPAVGAYGCSAALAPFLPTPIVACTRGRYRSTTIGRRVPARCASSWAMCRR